MGNKRRRLEDTSSEEGDDELMLHNCSRDTCHRRRRRRRLPNQVFRERRRRHLLVIRRLKRRRRNSLSSGASTSSEDEQSEAAVAHCRPRRSIRCHKHNVSSSLHVAAPAARLLEKDKSWFRIAWRDIVFAVLSLVILIMFLETHIETWITGRPPHRFSCFLCGLVICCALWCLLMMQDDFDEDLRESN